MVGLVVAAVLLGFLLGFAGLGDVVAALRSVGPSEVLPVFALALGWIVAWSLTLALVLGSLEVTVSPTRGFALYLNVLFANSVAPFSVGGGEPIAALLVSRSSRVPYETALLAVFSTSLLNYLPAPLFAVAGLSAQLVTTSVGGSRGTTVLSLVALLLAFGAAGAVAWRYRRWFTDRAVTVLLGVQQGVRYVFPGVRPRSRTELRSRIAAFERGAERVAADRRTLALGLVTSGVGWVLQGATLQASLAAVGLPIPATVALAVVTVVAVTDVVPLPGGIGSFDAVLVGVVVSVTDAPVAVATAGALVFRSAVLLFPVGLGGLAVVILQGSPARED